MESLLILLLSVAIRIYSLFSWAYVVSIFYMWFIIPLNSTLPYLTTMHFAGILLFTEVLITKARPKPKKEYLDETEFSLAIVFGPWMTLIFGWFIHNLLS